MEITEKKIKEIFENYGIKCSNTFIHDFSCYIKGFIKNPDKIVLYWEKILSLAQTLYYLRGLGEIKIKGTVEIPREGEIKGQERKADIKNYSYAQQYIEKELTRAIEKRIRFLGAEVSLGNIIKDEDLLTIIIFAETTIKEKEKGKDGKENNLLVGDISCILLDYLVECDESKQISTVIKHCIIYDILKAAEMKLNCAYSNKDKYNFIRSRIIKHENTHYDRLILFG